MTKTYQQENDELIWNMLHNNHLLGWKYPEKYGMNHDKLELIVNYTCNLGCLYCYVNRFGEELYPPDTYSGIMENLEILLGWLKENNYTPQFEIFSGEPLIQDISLRVLDRVIDHLIEVGYGGVIIPTNLTFLLDDELTKRVEGILTKAEQHDVKCTLSASVDGKYMETNRPFRRAIKARKEVDRLWYWDVDNTDDPRGDEFYDKFWNFAQKWSVGLHPMIYSRNISLWEKNFLWFQENMKRIGRHWASLYLLEVRNVEWSLDDLLKYREFIKFLVRWSWEKCDRDFEKFYIFLFTYKGFNILMSPFSSTGRGIGCSMQGSVQVRLGDLAIVSCHRTSYNPFLPGWFRVEDGKIVGFKANNPEQYIAMQTLVGKYLPYCEKCTIREICNYGCLGSQLEVTGDLYTPIPTVCQMYHMKMVALIEVLSEIGIYDRLISNIQPEKARAFGEVRELMKEVNWK